MDDGLVLKKDMIMSEINVSLNPYCSGLWSRTFSPQFLIFGISSLNPYCSGLWSRTLWEKDMGQFISLVS